jgi:hypothetical protein
MKRYRILFFSLVIATLLASNFPVRLNAQSQNRSKASQIAQENSAQLQSPITPSTAKTPNLQSNPSSPPVPDMPPLPNWVNWVGLLLTLAGSGLLALIGYSIRSKVWIFRPDSKAIKKSKKLLENLFDIENQDTSENFRVIDIYKIDKRVKETLILCLRAKDELNKGSRKHVHLEEIVRIFIEHKILEDKDITLENIKKIKRDESGNSRVIVLKNCFDFYHEEKQKIIKQYLKLVMEINGTDVDTKFVCPVQFTDGFIAPLYLITGPLRYFENAWPKIITEYNSTINNARSTINNARSSVASTTDPISVQSIQSSIFTTWIAWGPSIPICKCDKWGRYHSDQRITLQYGFGDENNSIPILLQKGEHMSQTNHLELIFSSNQDNCSNQVSQATITATPVLLSKTTREQQIATAQTELIDGVNDELVLDFEKYLSPTTKDNEIIYHENRLTGSVNYYTAYVWILFSVIEKGKFNEFENQIENIKKLEKKLATFKNPDNKTNQIKQDMGNATVWRQLLPFFEHVNIADSSSYEIQKKALVYKSLEMLKELHSKNSDLEFVYLCAFDHCNCCDPVTKKENELFVTSNKTIKGNLIELIEKEKISGVSLPTIHTNNPSPLPAHELPNLIDKMNKYIK